MAFRTNKTPAIEERTVSGSSVSFHSNFALPLKACKVSFEATQSGSGTPSPSNPLPISGVSAIGLNANSTPVSVSLGDTRYGGELDVLTGILTLTHFGFDMGNNNWFYSLPHMRLYFSNVFGIGDAKGYNGDNLCSCYKKSSVNNISTQQDNLSFVVRSDFIAIRDNDYQNNANAFIQSVAGQTFVLELAEPITIQLSANELSSIIGNNTFSTDTGTLEITFADLQEKSASGAVASFNTALAMPLVECKTEFMCTQEAGTPSPSNPLAITGVDDITLTVNGNSVVIDLDGTRYGGYVDVVGKKLVVTNVLYQPTTNDTISGQIRNNYNCWCFTISTAQPIYKANANAISNINIVKSYVDIKTSGFCKILLSKPIFSLSDSDTGLSGSSSQSEIYEAFKTFISTYNPMCVYELSTPIEISLSDIPTLSTIIGNNSFVSDSGSIELTYKDLDIAKRGNFREVFKLPS